MILSAVFYQDRMHIYIRTGRFPLNYRAWIATFFRGSAPDPIVAYFHMDLKLIPSPPTQKYAPASLLVMHYNCSRLSLSRILQKEKEHTTYGLIVHICKPRVTGKLTEIPVLCVLRLSYICLECSYARCD